MPFKLKLIKNIKKHMANYNKTSSEEEQDNSRSVPNLYNPQKYQNLSKAKTTQIGFFSDQYLPNNAAESALLPAAYRQLFQRKFWWSQITSINEEALKSPDCQ